METIDLPIPEMAQRYPVKEKTLDGIDGRTRKRVTSQVDDLLAFIPTDSVVLRKDLYEQTRGKIARDDLRPYLDRLLREKRIFAHNVPYRTRPLIAYCQKALVGRGVTAFGEQSIGE